MKYQNLILFSLIALLLLALTGLFWLGHFFADTFTSAGPNGRALRTQDPLADFSYRQVALTTSDGLTLQAFYVPSRNGAAVILLHGYRSCHAEMFPLARILVREGYGVILPDLRGHGWSEGSLVSFGKSEVLDADAAFHFLLSQPETDPGRIAIAGNSLGASTAILYAARNPAVRAVAAQSPFASLNEEVWYQVETTHLLPAPLLAPFIQFWLTVKLGRLDDFAPLGAVSALAPRPVFILEGGQDTLAAPGAGQRLYAAAGQPKTLWYDPAVKHVDFQNAQPQEFDRRMVAFFGQRVQAEH
jgi:uncharacterized protein